MQSPRERAGRVPGDAFGIRGEGDAPGWRYRATQGGCCPGAVEPVAESATLTDVSLVVGPGVNFTDGSSNSREEALIPE